MAIHSPLSSNVTLFFSGKPQLLPRNKPGLSSGNPGETSWGNSHVSLGTAEARGVVFGEYIDEGARINVQGKELSDPLS